MNKQQITGVVVVIVFSTLGEARADHPTFGFGSTIAGPITTISAAPPAPGHWSAGLRMDYVSFDAFSDASLEAFAGAGAEVHSVDYLLSTFLWIGYGQTEDFTWSSRIPLVNRTSLREGHLDVGVPEVHDHGDAWGVGDLTVLGQYRVSRMEQAGFHMALLGGLKMPTGNTDVTSQDGLPLDTEFQPGSGSWDPLFGVAATQVLQGVSLAANVLYLLATEGSDATDLGDALSYNAALSYRLGGAGRTQASTSRVHRADASPSGLDHDHSSHGHRRLRWDIVLELNGEWRQRQRRNGVEDENSGGNRILLSPGLRLLVSESWSAAVSAGFPVFEDLGGIQHGTDYRIAVGISIGL